MLACLTLFALSGCEFALPAAPADEPSATTSAAPSGPLTGPPAQPSTQPSTQPPTPPSAQPSAGQSSLPALAQLDELRVLPRPHGTQGYQRSAFGSAWRDTDGNGCNQRDDVLLRDAVPGTTTVAPQGRCDHDVLAGTFIDPYSGRTHVLDDLKNLSQAQAVQIDHVVPLAEAWVSGASSWPQERRSTFANDLDVLLAVDGATNASKGASDPAAWRPRRSHQCDYAQRWIRLKHRYDLAADPSEVRALREMLGSCA